TPSVVQETSMPPASLPQWLELMALSPMVTVLLAPPRLNSRPPWLPPARLLLTALLVSVKLALAALVLIWMPPPSDEATLPVMVQLRTLNVVPWKPPPAPPAATLPVMMHWFRSVVWPPVPASMPPPSLLAVLPLTVLLLMVNVWLRLLAASMPPPSPAA